MPTNIILSQVLFLSNLDNNLFQKETVQQQIRIFCHTSIVIMERFIGLEYGTNEFQKQTL